MAMETMDNAQIIQFSDMVHVAAQQAQARMRPYTQLKQMSGDIFAYDGLGSIEAQELFGRIQPTVFSDIEHLRRKISRRRFSVTIPLDKMDEIAVLIDPQRDYAAAVVRAMERVYDRVVVEAMFADVYTGRDFDTTVTYATDGGFTVDATSGLTYDILLEIGQNYIDADVGNDVPEKIVMGITGGEHTDLMNETELTSGDFSREYVVDKGKIVRAAGIDIVKFAANANSPILDVNSGVRDCFAASTRGICVGMSKEMSITIKDRPDLVDVKQVQIVGILGAVRTEGKLIQKVQTTV